MKKLVIFLFYSMLLCNIACDRIYNGGLYVTNNCDEAILFIEECTDGGCYYEHVISPHTTKMVIELGGISSPETVIQKNTIKKILMNGVEANIDCQNLNNWTCINLDNGNSEWYLTVTPAMFE